MKWLSCVVVNMQAAALVISWLAAGKNLLIAPRIICAAQAVLAMCLDMQDIHATDALRHMQLHPYCNLSLKRI